MENGDQKSTEIIDILRNIWPVWQAQQQGGIDDGAGESPVIRPSFSRCGVVVAGAGLVGVTVPYLSDSLLYLAFVRAMGSAKGSVACYLCCRPLERRHAVAIRRIITSE